MTQTSTVINGAAQIIDDFDVTNGVGGLFVNDNLTPNSGNNSGLSISATTVGKKSGDRADNPYDGQTPNVHDVQELYDNSSNKSGTVTDVGVVQ